MSGSEVLDVARSAIWLTVWSSTLVAVINVVFGTLTDLGATGRGLFHLSLRSGPTASNARNVLTLGSVNQGYEMSTASPLKVSRRLRKAATCATKAASKTANRRRPTSPAQRNKAHLSP